MSWLNWLYEQMIDNSTLMFFVVLVLGYLVGRIGFRGFKLGGVAGVLFAGLLFGHFGFGMSQSAQDFGFALFIFSVGYQAGPQFFEVVRQDGMRYFLLALVVAGTGLLLAVLLTRALGLEFGSSAGILGGALTTTPTLAAAETAVRSGAVPLPPDMTAREVTINITTSYAITYLFGLVGLIMLIRLWPKFVGVNLAVEARKLEGFIRTPARDPRRFSIRAYRFERGEGDAIPIVEAENRYLGRAAVLRIRRDGELVEIDAETCLQDGDEVVIQADPEFYAGATEGLGREIFDRELLDIKTEVVNVSVTNRNVLNSPFGELRRAHRHGGLVIAVNRLGVDLPIDENLTLKRGDVLTAVMPEDVVERMTGQFGEVERDLDQTDLLTFALGVSAGILLGTLTIDILGVSIGLGSAGGLLVAGLLVGYLRSIHPVFGRVPGAARWVLMELGLLMFMAGVGIKAGAGVVETLMSAGLMLIAAGAVVTLVPFIVAWFFGRAILRLNPALLLGAIAGAMTSGACLKVVTEAAKSEAPALGYTGAYAFANVILTIAGATILYFG